MLIITGCQSLNKVHDNYIFPLVPTPKEFKVPTSVKEAGEIIIKQDTYNKLLLNWIYEVLKLISPETSKEDIEWIEIYLNKFGSH